MGEHVFPFLTIVLSNILLDVIFRDRGCNRVWGLGRIHVITESTHRHYDGI